MMHRDDLFDTGQDKPTKDATEKYDEKNGRYQENESAKPKQAHTTLPAEPQPFASVK